MHNCLSLQYNVRNDGNYEPINFKWASKFERARNTRSVILNPELVKEIKKRKK